MLVLVLGIHLSLDGICLVDKEGVLLGDAFLNQLLEYFGTRREEVGSAHSQPSVRIGVINSEMETLGYLGFGTKVGKLVGSETNQN